MYLFEPCHSLLVRSSAAAHREWNGSRMQFMYIYVLNDLTLTFNFKLQ